MVGVYESLEGRETVVSPASPHPLLELRASGGTAIRPHGMLLRPAITSCDMTVTSDAHVTSMPSAGSSPSMFQPFPPLPKSPFSSPCGSPKGPHSSRDSAHTGTGPCNGRCKADAQGTQHFCASYPQILMLKGSLCPPRLQASGRLPPEAPDAVSVGGV